MSEESALSDLDDEAVPASFEQRRLWFLEQYEPGTALYNIPAAWSVQGTLDREAMEQSLNEVVRRHDVLRTSFAVENEAPVQIIAEQLQLRLLVRDLSSALDAQTQAQRLVREEAEKPFDMARGPLIRAQLLKLGEQDHILLLTLHHIVADGWSLDVLMWEWCTLYSAFSAGQPSPLPDLRIQYADVALWQREWLQGNVLQEHLGYWTRYLEGAMQVLELPTDRLRPSVLTYRGAEVGFEFDQNLNEGLRKLSQSSHVTLFMIVATAFGVLLHRYSRQDDICIGYPVANRSHTETEGMVGFFVNTLVLRLQLNSRDTFEEALKRARESVLEADAHQALPFDKLVAALQPARSISHSPLFQVMIAFNNARAPTLKWPGLSMQPLRSESSFAKFELTLELVDQNGELRGAFEYNTDLFERATIERMVRHYDVLLKAIVADPQARVGELPLLTEPERHQLLVEWNDTRAEFPADECIHELFEAQVARTPQAVAVVFEDKQLTYAELNSRANQLARYLCTLGVGPDTLVAICVERSLEMVVGLLGILKAGGAYVPLDPEYPQKRLTYMLEDSAAAALLAQGQSAELFAGLSAALPVVDLVTHESSWAAELKTNLDRADIGLTSSHLAYVIYTSGSTGKPKGAMNEHRPVVNRLVWMQRQYRLNADSAVLQKTPFGFDVSVWEFFWPLMVGARLVMARTEGHRDPAYLIDLIRERNITTVHFVPSMLQPFLENTETVTCSGLVHVICSGETLPAPLARRFRDQLPRASLYNLYGPTETAVDVTAGVCDPEKSKRGIPIGQPIANARIYVLDSIDQPVPIGVVGEMYIGGLPVGRGYLNRPDMTAEKFIPNPYGEAGSRMYRTGDLGRYLPDGNIEFIGRVDHQVKLRGFRIELGEIENALMRCAGVREAVVVLREDAPDDERLVAYVVGHEGAELTVIGLRGDLQKSLPEYMLPAAYVWLEAMPLTPNGKVDRKGLPAPEGGRPELGTVYVAPRSPIEETLANIWTEVLKVERVGVNDNFFALGGHSLLATQVLARMRKRDIVDISVRVLFESPTVASLAIAIQARGTCVTPVVRGGAIPRLNRAATPT